MYLTEKGSPDIIKMGFDKVQDIFLKYKCSNGMAHDPDLDMEPVKPTISRQLSTLGVDLPR